MDPSRRRKREEEEAAAMAAEAAGDSPAEELDDDEEEPEEIEHHAATATGSGSDGEEAAHRRRHHQDEDEEEHEGEIDVDPEEEAEMVSEEDDSRSHSRLATSSVSSFDEAEPPRTSPPAAAPSTVLQARRAAAAHTRATGGARANNQRASAASSPSFSMAATPSVASPATRRVASDSSARASRGTLNASLMGSVSGDGPRPAKRQKHESLTPKQPLSSADGVTKHLSTTSTDDSVELICTVCFELPPGEIYQCGNGHLLCKVCHRTMLNEPKPLCPTCRLKLSRDHPARNRVAEHVLSGRHVPCSHANCDAMVRFADLKNHLAYVCGMRETMCEYRPLGCEWKGTANAHAEHQKCCQLGGHPSIDAILRHVQKSAEAVEQEKKLCKMLSKRCRDLSIRDVVIERDALTPDFCSKVFTACGLSWEVYLDPIDLQHPEVKIHLRIVSPVRKKIIIECFALAGPNCLVELGPTLRRVIFRKNVVQSESFPLPFNTADSNLVRLAETLSLRMGFLDCSPGAISSHFTTVNLAATAAVNDDSDSDDDDASDDAEEAAEERMLEDVVEEDGEMMDAQFGSFAAEAAAAADQYQQPRRFGSSGGAYPPNAPPPAQFVSYSSSGLSHHQSQHLQAQQQAQHQAEAIRQHQYQQQQQQQQRAFVIQQQQQHHQAAQQAAAHQAAYYAQQQRGAFHGGSPPSIGLNRSPQPGHPLYQGSFEVAASAAAAAGGSQQHQQQQQRRQAQQQAPSSTRSAPQNFRM